MTALKLACQQYLTCLVSTYDASLTFLDYFLCNDYLLVLVSTVLGYSSVSGHEMISQFGITTVLTPSSMSKISIILIYQYNIIIYCMLLFMLCYNYMAH